MLRKLPARNGAWRSDIAAKTPRLRALGYAWAAPTTLGSLAIFLLPMWLLRQARPGRWRDGAWEWVVRPGSRFLYALLWLFWGYRAHPLERDARACETDVL